MAAQLKGFYNRALVERLAGDLARVDASFPVGAFVRQATRGLEALELLDRARHIARALGEHLPGEYPTALGVLLASLGPELASDELLGVGMAPFFYLPHLTFIAERGLEHFELSLRAQYELTKRFSAEGSIRAYLLRDPERTIAWLEGCARDPNAHVRRLASEGTRLRLPWAPRVPWLDANPTRVLALLEVLKDDPTTLVRRSVANNLNDLGKVHPALLFRTCEAWLEGASEARRALVWHALRSAVKRSEAGALKLLGYGEAPAVVVLAPRFEPRRAPLGGFVSVFFTLKNTSRRTQTLLVDLVVHFVKARGHTAPRVFKLRRVILSAGGAVKLQHRTSLEALSTRKHYPGTHPVSVAINGVAFPIGSFVVTEPSAARGPR
ncbi:MAG: DNA alkylation repair protein [Deltaproteobacteria bacterium]|nr:DNA alkylation repair protein [Deltaproteobacteria bacterium]